MPLPNDAAQLAAETERSGDFAEAAHQWLQAARQPAGQNIKWCRRRAVFCAGVARRAAIKDPQ
ncbi:ANR family transcriptional regulator [Erwinia sp. E602]|uniref:ANR family transcriptional regulator n=1 Tax=Erwinia sp. E602 TaxID=2675378 RepID=UPI001BAC81B5|nr:ANR family transcriptional regulator [Erwinia sp. E602]QUG75440.1 ANR family transcriptional regulator [Erwinia sp. E602]